MTKKKQLRIENLKNDYAQREAEFDAAMNEAIQIADLAENILQLEKIKQDINSEINNFKPPKGSEKALKKVEHKINGFSETNKALYIVAVAPPTSIVTMAVFGSTALKDAATSSRRKKLSAEAGGHLQRMRAQRERVSGLIEESKREQIDAAVKQADLIADPAEKILQLAEIRENAAVTGIQFAQISDRIDAVVENNLKKLALSPLLGDVQAVRGIKEKFSEAAIQFIKDAIPAVETDAKPVAERSRDVDKHIVGFIR